jgi:hypothetical protein
VRCGRSSSSRRSPAPRACRFPSTGRWPRDSDAVAALTERQYRRQAVRSVPALSWQQSSFVTLRPAPTGRRCRASGVGRARTGSCQVARNSCRTPPTRPAPVHVCGRPTTASNSSAS